MNRAAFICWSTVPRPLFMRASENALSEILHAISTGMSAGTPTMIHAR